MYMYAPSEEGPRHDRLSAVSEEAVGSVDVAITKESIGKYVIGELLVEEEDKQEVSAEGTTMTTGAPAASGTALT